jgi:UDP-glucose 4-epimerase
MSRILVTGGTGMIGMNLSVRLAAEGNTIFYFCRPSADPRKIDLLRNTGEIVFGDMGDASTVKAAVDTASPDIVFHLASTAFNGAHSAAEHFQVITLGTLHLLDALRASPVQRLVVTGSIAEYGSGSMLREDHPLQPATLLGAAKANASLLVQTFSRLYNLPAVILRLCMPYGPWENPRRLIPHTILSALGGRDIEMTEGRQQRDFVYIDDVTSALLLAARRNVLPGSVFNIGSGEGTPVRDVVARILEIMGGPVKALMGAVPTRPDEIMKMSADNSSAALQLGWKPTVSMDEGLRRSLGWFAKEYA